MKKGNQHPPRYAKAFFEWCAGNANVDDLLGDVDELFRLNLDRMPTWRAKAKYWRQVFSLVFSYAITSRKRRSAFHAYSSTTFNFAMTRNYFTIAWRMLTKNKVFSIINVLGLTLGISACLIVYLVVSHEFSFDRFHTDTERIYRIRTGDEQNKGQFCDCIQAPGYTTLRDDFAGAEAITGFHNFDAKITIPERTEDKNFDRNTADIIFTGPEYFKIFQYEWIAGESKSLSKPFQVVLTKSRAQTYFGFVKPQTLIGKTIVYNDSIQVTVAGIVEDWTKNSDFDRTEFVSFATIEASSLRSELQLDNWGIMLHSSQSFIKLKPADDPQKIAATMATVVRKKTEDKILFKLQPLNEIHFNLNDEGEGSFLSTLYALTMLAAFILVIAAINFINLSTAQSIQRSKEIGIRKVMGSRKFQLVFQFLAETFLLAVVSTALSLMLVRPLLNVFETYLPKGIGFDPISVDNWLFVAGLLALTSLIAGIYPAFVVSSRAPVLNLSGRSRATRSDTFSMRKALIVFQFAGSLFFIIATLVISKQMDFIKKEDRGFSTESVATFRTNWRSQVSRVGALADRIRVIPGIDEVSMQAFTPMGFAMWQSSFEYSGKKEKIQGTTSIKSGDENFIPLYKIRLVAGRNFRHSDSVATEIVVNESFARAIGFQDVQLAIGEQIIMNGSSLSICGIVQDFHEQSFRDAIGPCVILDVKREQHSIAFRLSNSDFTANAAVIKNVEGEFKALFPDETFSSYYIEDEIGSMHGEEQKTSTLATIAMGVTIFISCMGVFGLATFTAAMRTREIGIRKVLGASVTGIVKMLSWEFMVLIVISIVLATPVAWFYMNNWLLNFTYRAELTWSLFAIAAVIALGTGLITVSFQSVRAAKSDPVKAIKTE